jgi:hypothetical protein
MRAARKAQAAQFAANAIARQPNSRKVTTPAARGRGGRGCQSVYGLTTRNVKRRRLVFGALQQWNKAGACYAWPGGTHKATGTRRSDVHFRAIRPHPGAAESQLRALFVVLLARRIVAPRRNELVVDRLREAEALLHVRHDRPGLTPDHRSQAQGSAETKHTRQPAAAHHWSAGCPKMRIR